MTASKSDRHYASAVHESVEAIVLWASQSPPMPRAEFVKSVTALLMELPRQRGRPPAITDAEKAEIVAALLGSDPGPGKTRPRHFVKRICDKYHISRPTVYALLREVPA